MNPKGQLSVLWALAKMNFDGFDGQVRNPQSDDEQAFWAYCLRTQPFPAISQLESASWGKDFQSNPYNFLVHRSVRDFLTQAALDQARADFELGAAGEPLNRALLFLASWKAEEDNSIFLKFLEHGGYEKGEVWRNEGIRHAVSYSYPLRLTAKKILLQRGQPIPDSVVTSHEVPF